MDSGVRMLVSPSFVICNCLLFEKSTRKFKMPLKCARISLIKALQVIVEVCGRHCPNQPGLVVHEALFSSASVGVNRWHEERLGIPSLFPTGSQGEGIRYLQGTRGTGGKRRGSRRSRCRLTFAARYVLRLGVQIPPVSLNV